MINKLTRNVGTPKKGRPIVMATATKQTNDVGGKNYVPTFIREWTKVHEILA